MIRILVILICLISARDSIACINSYRTLLSGKVIYTDPLGGKVSHQEIDTLELQKRAEELLFAYRRTDSIEYYSDYAAALTYLGDYQLAKKINEQIEVLSPNLYTTASNLGTVYELLGQPDSALIWIKKSIAINPKSHLGSEWIHLKILEFKISGSKEIGESILGLDFGDEEIPANSNKYDLGKIRDHIWHQLAERTKFVKPTNEIVGNIYFDFGNILALSVDVQAALESYEEAKEYGFTCPLMEKRIIAFEKLAAKTKSYEMWQDVSDLIGSNFNTFFWIGLMIFIAILLLTVWLLRRRAKRRRT